MFARDEIVPLLDGPLPGCGHLDEKQFKLI